VPGAAVQDEQGRSGNSRQREQFPPQGRGGLGATSSIALIAGVMNSTRVWAARELRLSDRASTSALIDTATNSSPVSAPARPATETPKSRHISGR
jgi:hypothetical protein